MAGYIRPRGVHACPHCWQVRLDASMLNSDEIEEEKAAKKARAKAKQPQYAANSPHHATPHHTTQGAHRDDDGV